MMQDVNGTKVTIWRERPEKEIDTTPACIAPPTLFGAKVSCELRFDPIRPKVYAIVHGSPTAEGAARNAYRELAIRLHEIAAQIEVAAEAVERDLCVLPGQANL